MLAKERESLVHFDHVLHVVGHGYLSVVDFAHAPHPLMLVYSNNNDLILHKKLQFQEIIANLV